MKTDYIIVLLLLTATFFMLLNYLAVNNLEFSRCNTGWNGTSGFFDLLDRHTTEDIINTTSLSGRKNSTLLIISPNRESSLQELSDYKSFIQNGNTLFIADDFGTGNKLLQGIGSSILIIPGILSSVDRAYNNSYIIITNPVIEHPLTMNVSSLILDKGVALEGGEPLIKTSLMSWIDTDNNGRITKKEMLGKYTILSHEKIGQGEVIVLSDSSVFINAMAIQDDNWDNRQFITNIIKMNDYLLIDQINSKTAETDGFSQVIQNLKSSPLFTILFVGMLMLGLIIMIQKRII